MIKGAIMLIETNAGHLSDYFLKNILEIFF